VREREKEKKREKYRQKTKRERLRDFSYVLLTWHLFGQSSLFVMTNEDYVKRNNLFKFQEFLTKCKKSYKM